MGVTGVRCLGDHRVGLGRQAGLGIGNRHQFVQMFVIAGKLPGVLFRVVHECDRLVDLRTRVVVGLEAAMIGGASVTHRIELGGVVSFTLCSTLCSMGGITGTL